MDAGRVGGCFLSWLPHRKAGADRVAGVGRVEAGGGVKPYTHKLLIGLCQSCPAPFFHTRTRLHGPHSYVGPPLAPSTDYPLAPLLPRPRSFCITTLAHVGNCFQCHAVCLMSP